jgi:photosystem II stability/assembly factor-like uncharacterized protein
MVRLWSGRAKRPVGVFLVLAIASLSLSACQGWFTQYSTTDASTLTGISCPSVSVCFAVGTNTSNQTIIKQSSNGGATWVELSGAASGQSLGAISCPDAEHCLAVGGTSDNTLSTNDGGTSWSAGTIPTSPEAATSVTCTNDQDCWATESGTYSTSSTEVFITTDGGTTWDSSSAISTAPSGAVNPGLTSVTCPTASECLAVGDDTLWYNPGPPSLPVPELYGILSTSTDGGMTWQTQTLPFSFAYGVSCLASTSCVAVGAGGIAGLATSDSGANWNVDQITVPGLDGYPEAVSCPDTLHCVAVGAAENGPLPTGETPIITTSDGGATWSVQTNSADPLDLYGVSCPTTSECWAAGATIPADGGASTGAIILKTVTGGVNWPSVSSISPTQGPATGGTQVTIMGAGFLDLPTVTFGTGPGAVTATNVTVVSTNELQVTVPSCDCVPAPGGVPVQVTVSEPGLGTSPVNLNYLFTYEGS